MLPLFPTIVRSEDGGFSNPRPVSIQKLVPRKSPVMRQFKHLPAARLQAAAERARADFQLEQTTRSLIQALNLQQPQPTAERAHRNLARSGSEADIDKVQSDSEISSAYHRKKYRVSDSMQHLPTATTLLSEQATQTAAAAARSWRASDSQLPSLQLLRALQARLVDALQQVNELRAEGPWQERVLDQPDWNRKLVRMEEFHAKITREMYILTRQVDLIMDSVCSVPASRVTSALRGDVIRKLVRAHRSALRVTQAFVQNYWNGSLDGRQAARFLEVLSICRNLVDICSHIGIKFSGISDLPERLAAVVGQHVTTAGDVGSLIREMALGRFGPAAEPAGRRRLRPPPRPGAAGVRGGGQRHHQKVKSTIERLMASRTSVRSAPVGRGVARPSRGARPGSAPHTAPKAAASVESVRSRPLTAVTEESADSPAADDPLDRLAEAVERAVGRALARVATEPKLTGLQGGSPASECRQESGRRHGDDGAGGRKAGAADGSGRVESGRRQDRRDSSRGHQENGTSPPTTGVRHPAQPVLDPGTQQQLRHVLTRLEEMEKERDAIQRRWAPLMEARKRRDAEDFYIGLEGDDIDCLDDWVPMSQNTRQQSSTGVEGYQPVPVRANASTSTTTLDDLAPAVRVNRQPPAASLNGHRGPTASLGGHQGPAASMQRSGLQPPAELQRSVRDLFASEALNPELRSTITAELRTFMGNSTDHAIRSLPEATINQLVDDFISEAGVDLFLHQLFDQEFELR